MFVKLRIFCRSDCITADILPAGVKKAMGDKRTALNGMDNGYLHGGTTKSRVK